MLCALRRINGTPKVMNYSWCDCRREKIGYLNKQPIFKLTLAIISEVEKVSDLHK